jgi:hypothetical protein
VVFALEVFGFLKGTTVFYSCQSSYVERNPSIELFLSPVLLSRSLNGVRALLNKAYVEQKSQDSSGLVTHSEE